MRVSYTVKCHTEADLKSTKIYLVSIFTLSVLVVLLSILSFKLLFSNTQKVNIPDYNFRLSTLIEQSKGSEILAGDLGGRNWDKVCFLGPYSTASSKVLGIDWEVAKFTDVLTSDGHNVIVFVKGKFVEDFIIQSRAHGDFSKLSGLCLLEEQRLIISKGKQVSAI